jgi:acetyl-CoA carboxylase biotin carboxyl carrier protein
MADDKRTEKEVPGAGPVSGKIDLDGIRQLLALMAEHDLAELEIEQADMAVRLRKAGAAAPAAAAAAAAAAGACAAAPAASAKAEEVALPAITSPMVGTFYTSPSPEAGPFVKVGDHVNEDTVVCIIEAMKVMNEIKAEAKGVITQVMVENAKPVEFGQPLFKIRPS